MATLLQPPRFRAVLRRRERSIFVLAVIVHVGLGFWTYGALVNEDSAGEALVVIFLWFTALPVTIGVELSRPLDPIEDRPLSRLLYAMLLGPPVVACAFILASGMLPRDRGISIPLSETPAQFLLLGFVALPTLVGIAVGAGVILHFRGTAADLLAYLVTLLAGTLAATLLALLPSGFLQVQPRPLVGALTLVLLAMVYRRLLWPLPPSPSRRPPVHRPVP